MQMRSAAQRRRSMLERLESRQLLAADGELACFSIQPQSSMSEAVPSEAGVRFAAEQPRENTARFSDGESDFVQFAAGFLDRADDLIDPQFVLPSRFHHHDHGLDFLAETDGLVFALDKWDSNGDRNVFVFNREDDNSLSLLDEFEIDFRIEETFVAQGRFYIIGVEPGIPRPFLPRSPFGDILDTGSDPDTDDLLIDLDFPWQNPNGSWTAFSIGMQGQELTSERQEFDGELAGLHQDGEFLVAETTPPDSGLVIAIYPPPPITATLTAFQFGPEGLVQLAETAEIERPRYGFGIHSIQSEGQFTEGRLLLANRSEPPLVYYNETAGTETAGTEIAVTWGELTADADAALTTRPNETFDRMPHVLAYAVDESGIVLSGDLILGGELNDSETAHYQIRSLSIADDGQTATVVRDHASGWFDRITNWVEIDHPVLVDLIDLSSGVPVLFETVEVSDVNPYTSSVVGQTLLLQDNGWPQKTLTLVDINQDIDISSENRVRQIDIPDEYQLTSPLAINDSTVAFAVYESGFISPLAEAVGDTTVFNGGSFDVTLLLLSLPDREFTVQQFPGSDAASEPSDAPFILPYNPISTFIPIDLDSSRFGILTATWFDTASTLRIGGINEDGQFELESSIELSDYLELDANEDRLIVRKRDRITEYRWDDLGNPTEYALGELAGPVEANDDSIQFVGDQRELFFDLLANDLPANSNDLRVTELIDAPEGFEILHGRYLFASAEAVTELQLLDPDSLELNSIELNSIELGYRMTDGFTSSEASVSIEVIVIRDDEIRELTAAIVTQAAIDLGVNESGLEIGSVEPTYERVDAGPDDRNTDDGIDEDGSPVSPTDATIIPGLIVSIYSDSQIAVYSASLNGDVVQDSVSPREFFAEISVHAVNEAGNRVDRVNQGALFWLEVEATDLRDFGQGVFATFIDIPSSDGAIEFVGPIETSSDYTLLGERDQGISEIDNLGVVSNLVGNPGSEPQVLMRIGVIAAGSGSITLNPNHGEGLGTETLLRGLNEALSNDQVRHNQLALQVETLDEVDQRLDVNDNGEVTASDALQVLNFLERFGAVPLLENESVSENDNSGVASSDITHSDGMPSIAMMQRMDTNKNGSVTAIDALVIINRLSLSQNDFEAESLSPLEDDSVDQVFSESNDPNSGGLF